MSTLLVGLVLGAPSCTGWAGGRADPCLGVYFPLAAGPSLGDWRWEPLARATSAGGFPYCSPILVVRPSERGCAILLVAASPHGSFRTGLLEPLAARPKRARGSPIGSVLLWKIAT